MKTIKVNITTLVLFVFFSPFCQSQNVQYRSKLRPVVKEKFDSLYPHATDVELDQSSIHDTTQIIRFNCNCDKTIDAITLVFDTNGNLLNKEVHYYGSLNGLPDAIVNYMKTNTSSTCTFINDYYVKYSNNKGEISYGIMMNRSYILRFKSTGELISKDAIPPVER